MGCFCWTSHCCMSKCFLCEEVSWTSSQLSNPKALAGLNETSIAWREVLSTDLPFMEVKHHGTLDTFTALTKAPDKSSTAFLFKGVKLF